jgi:hypothetical protein
MEIILFVGTYLLGALVIGNLIRISFDLFLK